MSLYHASAKNKRGCAKTSPASLHNIDAFIAAEYNNKMKGGGEMVKMLTISDTDIAILSVNEKARISLTGMPDVALL